MLQSMRDISLAVDEGRAHSQRIFKNAGTTGDGQWHDWSYASGQPSYDARIGTSLELTPFTAGGNDAIFFPGIPSGMERRLLGVDIVFTPGGTGPSTTDFVIYDLLGVYPLIDGDSTDTQVMDNTAALPRYSQAQAVLVNHVAPALAAADVVVGYVNQSGGTSSVTWRAPLLGQNKVNYTTAGTGTSGPLFCGLAGGDTAIRQINSVTFTSPPGGLWAIYMVMPLARFSNYGHNGLATVPSATSETLFALKDGFRLPLVKDGAWLGLFMMPATGGRTIALHGQFHFVWG